jgi:hypothetical protein
LNAFRITALPALMAVAARINHITNFPRPILIASMNLDRGKKGAIASPESSRHHS